jgi:hypothetical protein
MEYSVLERSSNYDVIGEPTFNIGISVIYISNTLSIIHYMP